jgi:hypoxanthine phosphoribosyltransferase
VRLPDEIGEVVFDREVIAATIDRLAAEIASDYPCKPLLLIGVLKGALFVTVDLARALGRLRSGPILTLDFIATSSYGNAARSSGEVRLLKDTSRPPAGRDVLIVEDIVDNGLTLQYLLRLLGGRSPASIRSCVLLDKPYDRRTNVKVDYVGLRAPDAFLVGYGLDYQEKHRNLPYLATLKANG